MGDTLVELKEQVSYDGEVCGGDEVKRYKEYISTDEKWLRTIPSNWQCVKMKYFFEERSEKGHPDEALLVSSQNMGVVPKSLYGKRTVEAMKDLQLLKFVKKGDFVISLRSFQGGIEQAYYQGIISPAYTVLIVHGMSNEYFRYLGKSAVFVHLLKMCVTGIREGQNIDYKTLKNHKLPVPPYSEQDQIVRFLDWKVSSINKLINIKKKEIAELMKLRKTTINKAVMQGMNDNIPLEDSGVPWIGNLPYTWRMTKLGRCVKSISDIDHYMPNSVDDGFPYVMTGDLKPRVSQIDLNKCKMISETEYRKLSKKSKAEKGDLIFSRYASVGTVSYVDVDTDFLTSYSCVVIKVEKQLFGKYLFYYMQSSAFSEDVNQYIKINTQGNVGKATLQMVKIPIPSLLEQKEIVDYLDKQIEKIDHLSEIKRKEVNALQEYKTRLISDTVTGQIDVRDIAIPEYEYVEEDLDDEPDSADESEEPTD